MEQKERPTMLIKLNPCAKCGKKQQVRWVEFNMGCYGHYVQCQHCFYRSSIQPSLEQSDAAWNAANPIKTKEEETHAE